MKDVSKVKAVLFDLDNTLIDLKKIKERAVESAIEAMIDTGLPMRKEEAIKEVGKIYGEYGWDYQKVFDDLIKSVRGEVDYKILATGVVAYRKVKEGYTEPYPNVISTLVELIRRGYTLGIISDAPTFEAWSRIAGMKLHHYFNLVIAHEKAKKGGLPFKTAIEKLRLNSNEIMMIGDDPENDIAGANALGIITVFVNYGPFKIDKSKKEQIPDYEISDIKELLQILK